MLSYDCRLCNVQLCSLCCCVVCNCAKNVLSSLSYVQKMCYPMTPINQSCSEIDLKKKKNNWINSKLLILIFGKIERGRRLPLVCPQLMLSLFNFEFIVKWRESTKKDFKLDFSSQKKIKNQDEEKKGKNIDGEAER